MWICNRCGGEVTRANALRVRDIPDGMAKYRDAAVALGEDPEDVDPDDVICHGEDDGPVHKDCAGIRGTFSVWHEKVAR